jgi:hypothetical protein
MRDLKKDVLFIAVYENGNEETFGIAPSDLDSGIEGPMEIAKRLQLAAWLPQGKILSVGRMPER